MTPRMPTTPYPSPAVGDRVALGETRAHGVVYEVNPERVRIMLIREDGTGVPTAWYSGHAYNIAVALVTRGLVAR
jgi:hypothetical protein